MLLRVVMVTTLLLIATSVEVVSETFLEINALYLLIVATYVLTIVHVLALRFVRYLGVQVYAQVVLDLLVITGLVYLTGGPGTRAGFMLLYPLSVLSGSVLLFRRQGLLLAGVATFFHAALLWGVREGSIPPGPGMADVSELPVKALLYSILLTACLVHHRGHDRRLSRPEPAQSVGAQLEEVSEQVAGLQELNQVLVESIQSGLMMADSEGRIRYLNRYGEAVLGRRTGGPARTHTAGGLHHPHVRSSPLRRARSRADRLARLELSSTRQSSADKVDLGISVSCPSRPATPTAAGYLLVFQDLTVIKRLEREVRVKEKLAAVGEMASQLAHEIRNPLGRDQRLGAGAHGRSQHAGRAGPSALDHHAGVEAPFGDAQSLPLPGAPGVARGGGAGGSRAAGRGGGHAPAQWPRGRSRDTTSSSRRTKAHTSAWPMPTRCCRSSGTWPATPSRPCRTGVTGRAALRRAARRSHGVDDKGRGIAGDDHRRLFEPFQTQSRVGTGLGLAIVYRIVREHRGDIHVRTAPGQGTEFDVYLPLVAVPVSA